MYALFHFQSFGELNHRPLLVDLTVEEQTRLKVIYGSAEGFHAVDLDSATVYDIYLPKHVSNNNAKASIKGNKFIVINSRLIIIVILKSYSHP